MCHADINLSEPVVCGTDRIPQRNTHCYCRHNRHETSLAARYKSSCKRVCYGVRSVVAVAVAVVSLSPLAWIVFVVDHQVLSTRRRHSPLSQHPQHCGMIHCGGCQTPAPCLLPAVSPVRPPRSRRCKRTVWSTCRIPSHPSSRPPASLQAEAARWWCAC